MTHRALIGSSGHPGSASCLSAPLARSAQRLALALALLSTACGGADSADGEEAPPSAAGSATEESPAAALGAPEAPTPTPTPVAATEEPAMGAETADDPPGPTASGDSYELAAAATGAPYAPGSAATFGIRLSGKNGWHVNTEYPIRVTLSGEGLTYPNASLGQGAAAAYEEAEARFDVPFSAQAGEHLAEAEVSFAMCNPANCIMETRLLALPLTVQ